MEKEPDIDIIIARDNDVVAIDDAEVTLEADCDDKDEEALEPQYGDNADCGDLGEAEVYFADVDEDFESDLHYYTRGFKRGREVYSDEGGMAQSDTGDGDAESDDCRYMRVLKRRWALSKSVLTPTRKKRKTSTGFSHAGHLRIICPGLSIPDLVVIVDHL